MTPYGQEDVERAFPAGTFANGRAYHHAGRVIAAEFADDRRSLSGHVQGSASRPYSVVAYILPPEIGAKSAPTGRPRCQGVCSCPVSYNCKHVVALLLHGLTLFSPGSSPGRRPVAAPEEMFSPWLAALDAAAAVDPEVFPPEVRHRLLYQLSVQPLPTIGRRLTVEAMCVLLLKSGELSRSVSRINAINLITDTSPAKYLRESDLFILRTLAALNGTMYTPIYPLQGAAGAMLLERILATGRARWRALAGKGLGLGPPVRAEVGWRSDPEGMQRLELAAADGATREVLPIVPPWYVDHTQSCCGPIETDLPGPLLTALLEAPAVGPAQANWLGEEITRRFPDRPTLRPATFAAPVRRAVEPIPCLRLSLGHSEDHSSSYDRYGQYHADYDYDEDEYYDIDDPPDNDGYGEDVALLEGRLGFDYAGTMIEAADPRPELQFVEGADLVVVERRPKSEKAALSRLKELGFSPIADSAGLMNVFDSFVPDPLLGAMGVVLRFLHREVPALEAEGWRIEIGGGVPDLMGEPDDWAAEVDERGTGIDWFGVSLGVSVAGERVDLVPVLLPILRMLPRDGDLAALDDFGDETTTLYAPVGDGRVLPLPLARVRPLLVALYDLFRVGGIAEDGSIHLSAVRLAELAELEAAATATRLRWIGGSRLLDLGRRLREGAGVSPVPPPTGLDAQLRPYQQQGLDWLQFLREVGFGGVLADDMGLGKTVQALAHVLAEKEAGRLDHPCLVVAPTSLMANWRREAGRFAPGLSVLTLHGLGRKADFERIADHDLVLTTYPLLARDKEVLLDRDWHLVILDEAQTIKNPKAQATLAAVRLRARHRLCLTGTPMENNLEELWSLFHFLAPGLLGDTATFRRVFRTPIEKQGDRERQHLLARRLKPFLLRRTKQEVAAELPEKTEIIESIELDGAQRDLYESIRVAMDAKVRKEVASKGLARSHIAILDALLKLRQVCCDPRLVKLAGITRSATSAKLERLMEMLPELIADGRRMLVFSQFTSMLSLIETELERRRIAFVKLTGQTRDRATPVDRFQAGEVPVFLISLKAGGTGLNLTAADTVILYDPWWNPAVERQATDRAHRIGQDKAVFVYKLTTVGTVEEAILTLQARKQALADGLFDPDAELGGLLTAEDIDLLFRPLG